MKSPESATDAKKDQYDHELTPDQVMFTELADALLEHRDEHSGLTFVDIVVDQPPSDVLSQLRDLRLGELLADQSQQLAIQSDGSHYPILDIKKEDGELLGVDVRAWGWGHEKIRYTDIHKKDITYPREYIEYPGEYDKVRQIDIQFSYRIKGESVVESCTLYGSTSGPGYITASSSLGMSAYAETGYEGHGGKRLDNLTDEDVVEFLELVAKITGDNPKSYAEKCREELESFDAKLSEYGLSGMVRELVDASWSAQAYYELCWIERESLDGKAIATAIDGADSERVEGVRRLLLDIIEKYNSLSVGRK